MGISTHILDTALGLPAAEVGVTLERWVDGAWDEISRVKTDLDGRCKSLLPGGAEVRWGRYRVRFETGTYFEARAVRCLYPYVEIVFEVFDERHYHIPLLVTANGYTTYRGS